MYYRSGGGGGSLTEVLAAFKRKGFPKASHTALKGEVSWQWEVTLHNKHRTRHLLGVLPLLG